MTRKVFWNSPKISIFKVIWGDVFPKSSRRLRNCWASILIVSSRSFCVILTMNQFQDIITAFSNSLIRPSLIENIFFCLNSISFLGFSFSFGSTPAEWEDKWPCKRDCFRFIKQKKHNLIFNLDSTRIFYLPKCSWITFHKANKSPGIEVRKYSAAFRF